MRIDFDKFVALNRDKPKFYKMVESTVDLFREYQNGDELKFPQTVNDINNIYSKKNISKTSYYVSRSILMALFKFIKEEYNIDTEASYDLLDGLGFNQINQQCNDQWFFKDIYDIYNFFDEIAKEKGLHIDDFVNYKCLCGLYYYGLNNGQIINIKQSNIDFDTDHIKLSNGLIEKLDNYTIQLLLTTINTRYYRNISTSKISQLGSSDYLVLSTSKDKNDETDIRQLLSSINRAVSNRQKIFKASNLRKIYWFNQIKNNNYTLPDMKEKISSDKGVRKKFEDEYLQWLSWLKQNEK